MYRVKLARVPWKGLGRPKTRKVDPRNFRKFFDPIFPRTFKNLEMVGKKFRKNLNLRPYKIYLDSLFDINILETHWAVGRRSRNRKMSIFEILKIFVRSLPKLTVDR